MEYQCSPLSCFEFYNQEEGLEELRHSLVYTTLELEATIVSAKEEISRKECELIHVNDLLSNVMKERDEARAKCQKLMLEKVQLLQQNQSVVTKSGSENEAQVTTNSSSECEENNSNMDESSKFEAVMELAEKKRRLPEKGKLLKAVVEAGPLLQTLLLAGPLPQWEHPPPQLNSIEIPPVANAIISSPKPPSSLPQQYYSKKTSPFSKKRNLEIQCPPVSKCRKVTTTPNTASHPFLP